MALNAAEQVENIDYVEVLASSGNLLKNYFPGASIDFSPWREDPNTRLWYEDDSLDLAILFPGWSPKLQCRSLLIQLRVLKNQSKESPCLLGVILRGVTFHGERWRLATIGDWELTGSHLPHSSAMELLQSLCRDLFALFPSD